MTAWQLHSETLCTGCSGKGYRIAKILEQLILLSKVKIDVCHSDNKLRPLDESVYIGDNSKLCNLG